ncbi:MAG TPA: L-2-hydroxyglutarate oxidase [Tepidisphaeraceae bacterium]|nr:L-2-hydroxyglutarate oxidase [Tepidisphaeraceae bacterium]
MLKQNPESQSRGRTPADVLVVGGGIVGTATAMALARTYRVSVLVIEAEERLAVHQTGNNSGVIHSGLYYKPGSLKAKLCTEGREAMYRFCQEHGVPHERCGKVVVAIREQELPALAELERRGAANGLQNLSRLSPEQIKEHEPHISGIAGLHVRETGIVDYKQVVAAYANAIREHGGEVRTTTRFLGVSARPQGLTVQTSDGDIECRALINCAGLHSDRVARLCGMEPEVQIVPFRGEYYELAENSRHLVRNLVYPVPDPRFPFLGVHFTRMVGGGVEAGPNAVLALARHGYHRLSFNLRDTLQAGTFPGTWRLMRKHWKTGMGEMYRSFSKRAFLAALRRLLPSLGMDDLTPAGAGVRAQAVERTGNLVDDFRIQGANRMIHVLNAPSPAATASLSIGAYIADLARREWEFDNRSAVSANSVA